MNIKELRESRKLSQSQFAKMLGVSQSTVNHLENGRINVSQRIADKV